MSTDGGIPIFPSVDPTDQLRPYGMTRLTRQRNRDAVPDSRRAYCDGSDVLPSCWMGAMPLELASAARGRYVGLRAGGNGRRGNGEDRRMLTVGARMENHSRRGTARKSSSLPVVSEEGLDRAGILGLLKATEAFLC